MVLNINVFYTTLYEISQMRCNNHKYFPLKNINQQYRNIGIGKSATFFKYRYRLTPERRSTGLLTPSLKGDCKRYRAGVNADLTPSTGGPVLTLCLPCVALPWGRPAWQGLGFSGLVHEETHPCGSTQLNSTQLNRRLRTQVSDTSMSAS